MSLKSLFCKHHYIAILNDNGNWTDFKDHRKDRKCYYVGYICLKCKKLKISTYGFDAKKHSAYEEFKYDLSIKSSNLEINRLKNLKEKDEQNKLRKNN